MKKAAKRASKDAIKMAASSSQQRLEGAQTKLPSRDVRQETEKTKDLARDIRDPAPGMTNNQGLGISDDLNRLRAGVRLA